jgi:hypothetical protein
MDIPIFTKLPGSTQLDFTFDWNYTDDLDEDPWLEENETIVNYDVVSSNPAELSVILVMQSLGQVTAWVTGGILGNSYILTCQVETSNDPPRIEKRMMTIKIVDKK